MRWKKRTQNFFRFRIKRRSLFCVRRADLLPIQKRIPWKFGKEAATDIPSWAKGKTPALNESGRDFAKRLCDEKYGKGNYPTGQGSEFNKLKKYGDRAF